MRLLFALFLALIAADAAAAQTSKFGIPSTSGAGGTQLLTTPFAQLPVCDVSHVGIIRVITDATSVAYNATSTGGGASRILVMCNGTNWVNQ